MIAPEFSRILTVDRLGAAPHRDSLTATAAECAALAARFGLAAIERLTAEVTVTRHQPGGLIDVRGRLAASVVQTCVVSGEPVPAAVSDSFVTGFVPAAGAGDMPPALEVGPDEDPFDDPEPFDGRAIDIGELVAQYLSLALDPYPRAPGAALPAGVGDADPADDDGVDIDPGTSGPDTSGNGAASRPSPFAVLQRLKDRS